MLNFRISEATDEYDRLVPFFIENELEFDDEGPHPYAYGYHKVLEDNRRYGRDPQKGRLKTASSESMAGSSEDSCWQRETVNSSWTA